MPELTVGNAEKGRWIETILFGNPSGNIFRLGERAYKGKRYGYKRFTQERVTLATSNKCRYVEIDD